MEMLHSRTVHKRAANLTASQAACSSCAYRLVMSKALDACNICEGLVRFLLGCLLCCKRGVEVLANDRQERPKGSGTKKAHRGRHKRTGNRLVCSKLADMSCVGTGTRQAELAEL